MTAHTVRYWAGPLDGLEEQINCDYPPPELKGYGLAFSKLGKFYQYSWARHRRPEPTEETPDA